MMQLLEASPDTQPGAFDVEQLIRLVAFGLFS